MEEVKRHVKKLSYKTLLFILKVMNLLTLVLFWAGSLVLFSMFWLFRTFPHVKLDELLYQLGAPIEGTASDMIWNYVLTALVPSARPPDQSLAAENSPSVIVTIAPLVMYNG